MTLRSNLGKEASVRTRNANSLQSVQAASRPLSLFGVPGRCSLATKSHLTLLHRERPDKAARSMTVKWNAVAASQVGSRGRSSLRFRSRIDLYTCLQAFHRASHLSIQTLRKSFFDIHYASASGASHPFPRFFPAP